MKEPCIGGNYSATINGITEATGRFSASVEGAQGKVTRFAQGLAVLDLASNYAEKLSNTISGFTEAGVSLDRQMHDLSAVAGVTGETLSEIEGYARSSAKVFGTDASTAVEGYKLLLSQLSPELGKFPEALQAMGNSIQTTSKLMGNNGTAAAEVLTTAMNQYGVSLADPMEASRKMAEMMNVMAAAGQAGSAELPAIKVALEQCGMAAKAANVSFEETNAAIQVLDKAGKKGSEGGVALRNTLAILGQGRFMPKDTREALQAAGIDVVKLADTSMSLKERLDMLKPVLGDAALFSKLFGMETPTRPRFGTGQRRTRQADNCHYRHSVGRGTSGHCHGEQGGKAGTPESVVGGRQNKRGQPDGRLRHLCQRCGADPCSYITVDTLNLGHR